MCCAIPYSVVGPAGQGLEHEHVERAFEKFGVGIRRTHRSSIGWTPMGAIELALPIHSARHNQKCGILRDASRTRLTIGRPWLATPTAPQILRTVTGKQTVPNRLPLTGIESERRASVPFPQGVAKAIGEGTKKRDYSRIRVPVLSLFAVFRAADDPLRNDMPQDPQQRAAVEAFRNLRWSTSNATRAVF